MEDKNINSQQPEELFGSVEALGNDIPEDMPQLDLKAFSGEPAPAEEPVLENLFSEEAVITPAEAEPVIAEEVPEPVFEDVPVEASEEEALPEAEEFVPEALPAEIYGDAVEAPEQSVFAAPILPAGEIPKKDFSDFDIPMDGELPVQEPSEIPGTVYPPEDYVPIEAPVFTEPEPVPPLAAEAPEDLSFGSDELETAYEEQPVESAIADDQEFTDIAETAAPEVTPAAARPVRKGRPKRKKGDSLLGIPSLLATLIWLGIIVLIGVSLGRMLWVCAADVLAFGRESKEVVVTIDKDDTIEDIAQILHEKGLINYPGVFELYASIAVDDGEIAPGTYTLNTILDYHALVGQMSHSSSSRAVVEDVLIPEGYNCRQIFELLEQNGICTVEELEEYAANGEFQDFWFLEGVERGDKYCLEGFLFPDTYDFYAGSTPREALGKMLLGFEARFTEELYSQLPALNERLSKMMRNNGCSQEFIDSHQLGLRELLTVASLIEEETAGASESPTIASVIYNRLTQDQEYERYLGIDAAIIYATGDAENIDTSIDHPYNTYKNAGLTPGPISNPGLSSINAALNFLDTDYYYYVLNPSTGEHQFSKTYEEHQEWIEKFKEMEPTEG